MTVAEDTDKRVTRMRIEIGVLLSRCGNIETSRGQVAHQTGRVVIE